ncbi:MAG: glycosyltransferase involved in cell wall biosynthesis [Psychroserpens sp.]|jgi:glycosyltransferase involved in cell wall biosynthesis
MENTKLKVLRIVTSMNPNNGGVVEAINQAALAFTIKKHQMDVLCFDQPLDDWVIKQNKYKIYALGKSRTSYAVNFKYLSWLIKNATNYDVVIVDGLWQFHVIGGYVLHFAKIPFCVFTHGMLDPYFNENKLKYFKKLPFWFFIERNVLSLANAALFTCEEEKNLASQSFPFYKSRPKVTTLGVKRFEGLKSNLTDAFFKRFPFLNSKPFGLFLSRIHPKKGLELLINSISKATYIPDDFIFVVAGPYEESYKKELEQLAVKLNVREKILWTGMLHKEEKWGAYHAADFFILPSHQENFGIVVAEALSTNTPVLITNKVNIWQEIQKEKAGFIEPDTIEGVTSLLESWFLLSTEKKNEMNKSAGTCYKKYYSTEAAVHDLENVLKDIIQNGN